MFDARYIEIISTSPSTPLNIKLGEQKDLMLTECYC